MVGPCIVAFCKHKGSHRFPISEERRKKWIEAVTHNIKPGLSVKKYSLICSAHFRPTDFAKTPLSHHMPDLAPKILKKTAVPSIFPRKRTGTSDNTEEQLLMMPSTSSNKNVEQISTAPSTSQSTDIRSKHVNAASAEDLPPTFTLMSSSNINIDDTITTEETIMSRSTSDSSVTTFDTKNALNTYSRVPPITFVEEQIFYQANEDIAQQNPLKSSDGDSIIETEGSSMSIYYNEDHEKSIIEMEIGGDISFREDEDYTKQESSTQTDGNNRMEESSTQTDGNNQMGFGVNNFITNDDAIHFYTGLESFSKFMLVFRTLGISTNNLSYIYGPPPKDLHILDCFFIVLIILRRHKAMEELSMLYQIPIKQVYNIFITWIRFMSLQWGNLDLWVNRNTIKSYMPNDFHDKFPSTRTILDATECPIKKSKLPLAQQITFSNYKNRNTVKVLIGMAPSGLITYVSPCYGGSATDRQIIERSSILERFEYNDEIMVDKGLNVQDIFIPYGVKVNMPAFFKKGNQISSGTLLANRKVASKRVHIERIIGMMKTYKILSTPMNLTETLLSSDIVFIIAMLVNFRTNIINKNA